MQEPEITEDEVDAEAEDAQPGVTYPPPAPVITDDILHKSIQLKGITKA